MENVAVMDRLRTETVAGQNFDLEPASSEPAHRRRRGIEAPVNYLVLAIIDRAIQDLSIMTKSGKLVQESALDFLKSPEFDGFCDFLGIRKRDRNIWAASKQPVSFICAARGKRAGKLGSGRTAGGHIQPAAWFHLPALGRDGWSKCGVVTVQDADYKRVQRPYVLKTHVCAECREE